jgi:hypothetical protein
MPTQDLTPVGAAPRFTLSKALLLATAISFSFTSAAGSETYLTPMQSIQQPPLVALGRAKPPVALAMVTQAPVALGRVQPTSSLPVPPDHWTRSICAAARDARTRNSPAAPGLERQCEAQPAPAPIDYPSLIAKGQAITDGDPLAVELRAQQIDDASRVGFDIGMAIAETDSDFGPGKQRIHDSLQAEEQAGFRAAVDYSLARNKKAELAAASAKPEPVAGMYKTTLRITSDTCPFVNYEQTSSANIQGPIDASRFIIQLQTFGSVLDGPIALSLAGQGLYYEGPVAVRAVAMPAEVPATFGGHITADQASFDISFDVRGYCTIHGTIAGHRL